ncbi:MAG: HYC_CC_PP family protein [Marinirhabdus sp.]
MKLCVSIGLSVLLLASSSGVTYAQHFCGDFEMIAKVTLGEKHMSCGMAMETSPCGDEHEKDHDCCENHYTTISTDDNFAKAGHDLHLQNTVAPPAAIFSLPIKIFAPTAVFHCNKYNPPPLIKNLPILYASFLI